MSDIRIKRVAVTVTFRCTLRCKLCGADVPYYKEPKHFTYEQLTTMISRFMELIDYVEEFELSGGEALMHEELDRIIEYAMQYKEKFDKLYIFTNGTILPKEKVWNVLIKYKDKCKFFISNYGEVSAKASELIQQLEEYGIDYKEKKYYGIDIHCGGWVDFGDFSLTKYDYKKCYYLNTDYCIQVRNGEVHMCGRSYRGMELGVIEKSQDQYIDLLADNYDMESAKVKLDKLINMKELNICKYCNGLRSDSKRFTPAEQIKVSGK